MIGAVRRGLLALGLALPIVCTPHAAASAAAACGGQTGVTVVVDYGSQGGTSTGCATGDPSSGLGALSGAGFEYVFAARQYGFVCRINGKPGTAVDACVNTSPTTAYWSYWYAQPGGSWVYSSSGAGGSNPAPGSVEGWSYGAGKAPRIAPPVAPAPPPPPQQAQPKPPAPTPIKPGVTTARPPVAVGSPAVPGSSAATSAPEVSSTAPTSSATGTTTGRSDEPVVEPVAGASTESGGGIGLYLGIGAILLVGGLAVWTARRRRVES